MKKAIFAIMAFLTPILANAATEFAIIPKDMYKKFKTGDFEWIDIVAFAMHLIELLLEISGVIAVILLMYAGFQYVFGAISDDKDKGKQTIKSTLIGLAVIILAWIIVDISISLITSTR